MEFAPTAEIKRNLTVLDNAGKLGKEIADIYQELLDTDLEPSPRVNSLFQRLVTIIQQSDDATARLVLTQTNIRAVRKSLHNVCALGEAKLESFWTARIAESGDPRAALKEFPYFENYRKLAALEFGAFKAYSDVGVRRALFVGSGPLPLSAILLAKDFGVSIDCLDNDARAVELARQLIGKLGIADKIRIVSGDARKFEDFSGYDLIILAALVGDADEKPAIINRISERMAHGSYLLIRSAHLLRTLLYPEASIGSFKNLITKAEIHPKDDVINSIIITKHE